MKKKVSPLKAIHAFCKECIYDPGSPGTMYQQIEECTAPECPLYEYRPITDATKRKLKQEYIDNLSPEEREKYEKEAEKRRKLFKENIST